MGKLIKVNFKQKRRKFSIKTFTWESLVLPGLSLYLVFWLFLIYLIFKDLAMK